jgi:hypothetical protein
LQDYAMEEGGLGEAAGCRAVVIVGTLVQPMVVTLIIAGITV